MSNKPIYFCVYRITNLVLRKHYYGYKSSFKHPTQVVGKTYFCSQKGQDGIDFVNDQKLHPENYRYKIVRIFDNKESALALEIKLHAKFDVGVNPNFYNKSKQTSTGFDTTGMVAVKDKDGNKFMVSVDDTKFKTGELIPILKNKVLCEDISGNNVGFIDKNNRKYNIDYFPRKVGFCKPGKDFSKNHREKLSKASLGVPKSKLATERGVKTRHDNKIGEGKNHWHSKYIYHTPWGVFDSPAALEPVFTMTRMKMFCLHPESVLSKRSYNKCLEIQKLYDASCVGKTFRELGFYFTNSKS